MTENDFYELQGNSYRGSRYSNFVGGGIDPQGNVSSGVTENAANSVGTAVEQAQSDAPPTPITPSAGLTSTPEGPESPGLIQQGIGAALPFAGSNVGQAAGAAIGAGSSVGEGVKQGASSLINKVSGGLLGTASSPTNIAISQMGGKFGPATSSAVNAASKASNIGKFASGANIGAAVGSGFATAAATLLTGGSVKDAAKAGVGTAVGTAIGNAILPGIGGFIGGSLGGWLSGKFGGSVPRVTLGTEVRWDGSKWIGGGGTTKGGSIADAKRFGGDVATALNQQGIGGQFLGDGPRKKLLIETNVGSKDRATNIGYNTLAGTRLSSNPGDIRAILNAVRAKNQPYLTT